MNVRPRRWRIAGAVGAAIALACTDAPPRASEAVARARDAGGSARVHPQGVPTPFEPVRVQQQASGPVVQVWGRQYRFDAGPLPSAITSQGEPLLRAPLAVEIGPLTVAWNEARVVAADERAAALTATAANLPGLRATTTVEYDGMILVDLVLSPQSAQNLPRLRYVLELPAEAARYYNHHLPYDYERFNVDKRAMLAAAGRIESAPPRLPFAPSLFLGGRRIGIEWWSETNAHWSGRWVERPFHLDRTPDAVTLRVMPISAPRRLEAGETWADRFALFPAPMRPPLEGDRSVRLTSTGLGTPNFAPDIGTRLVWIAMSPQYPPRWHGLPESPDTAEHRRMRRALERRGIGFIPYGKLTLAPNLHPRTLASFDEWNADGVWYKKPSRAQVQIFEKNGDHWKPGDPYSYAVCMGETSYVDWMLEENVRALREEGLAGLYFDHGGITRMCRNNPVLGGRDDREVWEYLSVRSFYKQLYEEMKAYDPDTLLISHTHGAPRAVAAFMDVHMIGEGLNEVFTRARHFREALADPRKYEPDYLAIRDWLTAQFFPPIGGATTLLPQTRYAIERNSHARAQRFQRGLYAWALAEDVPVMFASLHADSAVPVLHAVDRLGSQRDVQVLPWWSDRSPAVATDDAKVTVYSRPDRALLVAANWSDAPIETTIQVDAKSLGLGANPRVVDSERPLRSIPMGPGGMRVEIPAGDFRLLMLQRR